MSSRFAVHRSAANHAARPPTGVRSPSKGAVAVVLSLLGAAVYLATVLFAVGDGGVSQDSDVTAGRVSLAMAATLSGVALVLAMMGLAERGARANAAVGLVLALAFAAFSGLSLWRTF